ncbi:MAG: hypothetical protein H6573_27895 [Lewinellaceae bacterium]|nr:hypothetical protein [Lewinellaceae bacterium]
MVRSGINAIAVVDVSNQKFWGISYRLVPSKVEVSPDGKKLVIANAKVTAAVQWGAILNE